MLRKSADALADLYAEDAVHEIPFALPGFPPRFEGREAVRAAYGAMWKKSPVVIERVDSVAVYQATDPEVVIVEQVTVGGTGPGGPRFSMPSLLVLRVRNGLIVQCRDYMDGLAVSRARPDGRSAA
jgi:ketosteroid isomerase-like protein